MKLNGRLAALYDMIPPCGTLCDVGTDHALIPAKAVLEGRCTRAVAADVREGPLERARRTVDRFRLSDRVALRLGDGLFPFSENECEVVVLAGMGGLLITEILEACLEKAKGAGLLLLQPMHAQEMVRPWLRRHGFDIVDERLARDAGKLYEILAVRGLGAAAGYGSATVQAEPGHILDDAEIDAVDPLYDLIGHHLVTKSDPLLREWVHEKWNRQQRIVQGMRRADRPAEALPFEERRLVSLKQLLDSLGPLEFGPRDHPKPEPHGHPKILLHGHPKPETPKRTIQEENDDLP